MCYHDRYRSAFEDEWELVDGEDMEDDDNIVSYVVCESELAAFISESTSDSSCGEPDTTDQLTEVVVVTEPTPVQCSAEESSRDHSNPSTPQYEEFLMSPVLTTFEPQIQSQIQSGVRFEVQSGVQLGGQSGAQLALEESGTCDVGTQTDPEPDADDSFYYYRGRTLR